ncbi:5644_t:CDS:2, partial [Gigaspora rosea]
SLRDDTKVGSVVKGYLMRNDFFTNNKIELYFTRKEKKVKEKITTETTLNMANQRLALATKEAESSTHPVEVYNNSNTQTKDFSCYLDEIPPHAEYSHMGKDWIMNGINLSNNLKEIGIIKRGHFNFSDTDCTSQI